LAKKSRSLASLGMTRKHFFRRLFSLWGFVLARTKTHRLKPALPKPASGTAHPCTVVVDFPPCSSCNG
jgi:hypothetical protein